MHFFPHFYFAGLSVFGLRVIVVVELNCEIHIAHNLKIKLLKVKFVHLFPVLNMDPCVFLFFFFLNGGSGHSQRLMHINPITDL